MFHLFVGSTLPQYVVIFVIPPTCLFPFDYFVSQNLITMFQYEFIEQVATLTDVLPQLLISYSTRTPITTICDSYLKYSV